ncbi:MAG: DUF445 family protein [Burkholderiales bacterium]|nr:DUF445 family protein [Burkholderiales bacterium]
MWRIATGLLVLMALVFLAARYWEPVHPALAWVRAFAEAGMVGALADWFAVTALFRHPLGLPIPHTAIVPRNKDRIGRNLGEFVERNFLAPEVVREKIADVDFIEGLAAWLGEADRPRKLAERIGDRLPALFAQLETGEVRRYLQSSVNRWLEEVDLARAAGELLGAVTATGRHRGLVDQLIVELARLLAEYEPSIRAKVREKTAWYWRSVGLDLAVSDRIIAAAEEAIAEMARDPEHPWRRKLDAALADLAEELKTSARYRRELAAFTAELVANEALQRELAGAWDAVLAALTADLARPDSLIVGQLERGIGEFAAGMRRNDAARARLNRWLRGVIVRVADSQRHELGLLIAETVEKWDARTFTERIESYVGDDLQYVRINGTLIGGLVGLAIHAVSRALG